MSNPWATVAMAIKDGADTLQRCIASLDIPDNPDIEFIFVDDGSVDRTVEILRDSQTYENVRLLRNSSSRGLAYSLNRAIELASAEHIIRIDCDDENLCGRFSTLREFQKAKFEFVCSSAILVDDLGRYICKSKYHDIGEITRNLPRRNLVIHPSVMYSKQRFYEAGRYNEELAYSQDGDLWPRFFALQNLRSASIREPLIRYTHSMASTTGKRFGKEGVPIRQLGFENLKVCLKQGRYPQAIRWMILAIHDYATK